MDIKEAIEGIFNGESILFVGSGFSFGATNSNPVDDKMKSSTSLSDLLLGECGVNQKGVDLTKASQIYIARHSAEELVNFLKKEFVVSSISDDQKFITSMNWLRVYTTNYDDILEKGYALNKKICTPVTLSDKYQNINAKDKQNLIIHLNGFIRTLTAEKLNNEFKLTNASYHSLVFNQSPWHDLFHNDLRVCKSVFFIGFSMDYDLDLSQIIVSSGLKNKAFFIVSDDISEIDKECMAVYGDVLPIKLAGFVNTIKRVQTDYRPIAEEEIFSPISFRELHIDTSFQHVTNNDFYELLMNGVVKQAYVSRSLQDTDFKYCVNRTALSKVAQMINNHTKSILIASSLGNGKTLFLHQLAALLLSEGRQVFWYEKYTEKVYGEIGIIRKKYPDAVIIVDDYHTAKNIIHSLAVGNSSNVIVTSERQSYHDAIYDEILSDLGAYETVSIDKLNSEEVAAISKLFEKYSVWGTYSASAEDKRMNYIRNYCKSQISLLILSQISSSHISKKIYDAYELVKKEQRYKYAFIVLLIAEYFSIKPDMYDYSTWVGVDLLNNPVFKNNIGVKEFINFDENEIRFKSSIVSQYFLHTCINPEEIIDVLIEMMKVLDTTVRTNTRHKEILISLMNFAQLRNCVDNARAGAIEHLLRYYDAISNLSSCQDNIHFWLQYAIARLEEKNYLVADMYFKKCYALAANYPNYLTYKIDNHYSRYLLENAMANNKENMCMDAFRRAHTILIVTNHGEERTIYPYRMARLYIPFYKQFSDRLTPDEKKELLDKCNEMREKCRMCIKLGLSSNIEEVQKTEKMLSGVLQESNYIVPNSNFRYGKLRK